MENIRSHKKTKINFEEGITIVSGRTGSGKSSVLMGIEYCLFGATTGINKGALLRRGSKKGHIILEVEHRGNNYRIARGFVRSGKNILGDHNVGSVKKNNEELLKMARENDINKNVMDILGYPDESKAKNLFETTTYTKQDEIRKLINLTKTERKEYIDSVLNLSKYKIVWDNSIEVTRELKRIISGLEGEIKSEEVIKDEIENSKKKIENNKLGLEENSKKFVDKKREFENFEEIFKKKQEEINKMEEMAKRFDSAEKIVSLKKNENEKIETEKNDLSEQKKLLEGNVLLRHDYETSLREFEETKQKIFSEERRINEIEKEYSEVLKIEGGKCPMCKQEINEEHKEKIRHDFQKKKQEIDELISELKKNLETKQDNLTKAKKQKDSLEKIKQIKSKLEDLEKRFLENKRMIEENIILSKEFDKQEYEFLKKEHQEIIEKRMELNSEKNSLMKTIEILEEQLKNLEKDLDRLNLELKKMFETKEKLVLMKCLLEFFSKAREDIRNIGDVARSKFIRDFRKEFQSRFEEIRRWEQEYSVDIKQDYEPFAYTEGEEVPISNLSGGEKTSVALAYRLALSDIASRLGGVSRSKTLILDEPTTGFDREDIKVLPEVLRNIKNIPQIIIVTHESELKEAADQEFIVEKTQTVSTIQ